MNSIETGVVVQVKPFRKLRKVHNQGKRTRLRDLVRYDLRQMHAAFTGTLPVGSSSEPLGQTQVSTLPKETRSTYFCCSALMLANALSQ